MPNKKIPHEVVAQKAISLGIELLSPYRGCKDPYRKIDAKCVTCGHLWQTEWCCLKRGSGCPKCGHKRSAQKHKLSPEQIEALFRSKGVVLVGPYLLRSEPTQVQCITCAHVWTVRVQSIRGCPHCKHEQRKEKILQRFAWRRLTMLEDPQWNVQGGLNRPVLSCCSTCAHEWRTDARSGCPECRRLKDVLPDQEVSDRLKSYKLHFISREGRKIRCSCQECGYKFNLFGSNPKSLNSSGGCPKCKGRNGESEAKIIEIAEKLTGWEFPKARPAWLKGRSTQPMELDGYNAEHKVAIEYQGIQHYKPIYGESAFRVTKRNDDRKRKFCARRCVLLICVSHWKKDPEVFIRQKLERAGFLLA